MNESFQTIIEQSQEVPGQLGEIQTQATTYQQDVLNLIRTSEGRLDALQGLSARIQERLQAVEATASDTATNLRSDFQAVEQEVAGLRDRMTSLGDTVVGGVNGMGQALGTLTQSVEARNQAMQNRSEGTNQAVEELRAVVSDGEETLRTTVEQVSSRGEQIVQELGEERSTAGELSQTISENLNSVIDSARGQLDQLVGTSIPASQSSVEGVVNTVSEQVIGGTMGQIQEEVNEKIREEIRATIDRTLDGVANCLEEATSSLDDSKEESRAGRELVEPLLNQLEGSIAPLESAMDGVQAVADSLPGF